MKITIDDNIEQFILLDLIEVCITFDDDSEVKLNNITDYDIDLNKIENSTIELTTEFSSAELENRFKGKKINHINLIHIEAKGYVAGEDKDINVFYDIPCDMTIRRLRINGCYEEVGKMFVSLEGFVN